MDRLTAAHGEDIEVGTHDVVASVVSVKNLQ